MVENSDGDGLEGSQMQQTEAARKQMEMTKTTVELMTKPTEITELVPKGVVLRTQPLQATDETQTRLELREEPLQSIEVNHVGLQSRTGPVQGIEIDHVGFESRAPQVQDIESNMIGHESRTESVQNAKITQVGVGSRTQHPQSVQLPVDLDKEHHLIGCPLQLVIETFVKDNFKEQLKRARKGDSHAQIILGHMISHGYGVQKNPLKGSEWIKRGYSKHKQRKELPEKKSEDEDLYFM
ncbi:hypothetical protein KP509_09G006700 [Ceratopteris richardii]|nr:hypothetical protein KP509_09G006700 [Ceratopteris richardii]